MLSRKTMPAADLLSGCGLGAAAIAILVRAARMPMSGTYGGVDNAWYASPAAFPIVIGVLSLLAAMGLVARGVMGGGRAEAGVLLGKIAIALVARPTAQRIALIFGMFGLYVAALQWHWFSLAGKWFETLGAGRLIPTRFLTDPTGANYWSASCLFLLGFVVLFGRVKTKAAWSVRLGCCLLTPLVVGYLFSEPLGVPLP